MWLICADSLNLPGMRILQFAFGDDARNLFLPHNYVRNCIAYTGTHDNDTSIGWYQTANEKEEKDLGNTFHEWARYRLANGQLRVFLGCCFRISPLQDILQQGKRSPYEFSPKSAGNWKYQFASNDLTPDLAIRIRQLNIQYNRIPAINRIISENLTSLMKAYKH